MPFRLSFSCVASGAASLWVAGNDDRSQIPLGLTGADMALLKQVDISMFGGVAIKKFIAAYDYSMFLLSAFGFS